MDGGTFQGGGGAGQEGVRARFQGGADTLEDTMINFRKVIYENVGKKTFISQQIYLYIRVTYILKFSEVLLCTYYADIPLYVHKTLPT